MSTIIDARGLSCPQPVLMALKHMQAEDHDTFEILVDTETSTENVARAAASQGWEVKKIEEEGSTFRLLVAR